MIKLLNGFFESDTRAALEKRIETLEQKIKDAQHIAAGANVEFFFVSIKNGSDPLISSILRLRDQMNQLVEKERMQNWMSEGLASFAEILIKTDNDPQRLAQSIIGTLVKYVGATLGALYLVDEEALNGVQLKLTASYAAGREQNCFKQRIDADEGLAGQAIRERKHFYVSNVPDGYVKVASGLGESLARNLFIVPLLHNGKIYGVIEIASLSVFKEQHFEFIEQVAHRVASTISMMHSNQNTQKLLNETRAQTKEMYAVQEQMKLREIEIQAELSALHDNYNHKIKLLEEREAALATNKNILEKALNVDGLLVDIAGRNRYVSQRIALLCEFIFNGRVNYIAELSHLVAVHDDSLKKIRNGGVPLCCEKEIPLPPASVVLLATATNVEIFWREFKWHVEQLISLAKNGQGNGDESLLYIENNSEKLLQLNNELVQACIRSQGREVSNNTYPLQRHNPIDQGQA
ncbi:hypothetical protein WSM22_39530 [Cytophagales bacterium WSM2-2]|nr:hypothetical protein WSM22_39530 [Cytophagales bacterium WSM2-2]